MVAGRRKWAWLVLAVALVAFLVFRDELPRIDIEQILEEIAGRLGTWTYLLVGVMAFLETGAFVGFVVPGEFSVVLGGAVAGQGEVSVLLMVGIAWLAAFSGDSVSFMIGHYLGRGFMLRHGHRVLITPERMQAVERYFQSHGGKTIVLGRFFGFVRPLAPFIAASSGGMSYRAFFPYSILGTGIWASTFVLLGYFFSRNIGAVTEWAGRGTFAFALVLAVVVGLVLAVRYVRVVENRQRIKDFMRRTPVLRQSFAVIYPLWLAFRPQFRFMVNRLTPGGLGLELTTLLALFAVSVYVVVLYVAQLTPVAGLVAGDAEARSVVGRIQAGWLTDIAIAVSELGRWAVVGPLAGLFAVVLARRGRWAEVAVILGGLVLASLGTQMLKDEIARPRPLNPLGDSDGYAFPSGHASKSVLYVWLPLTLAIRVLPNFIARFSLVAVGLIIAAAVGMTRVYLNVHYLSDVLAGWALGLACFSLIAAVALVVVALRQNGKSNDRSD